MHNFWNDAVLGATIKPSIKTRKYHNENPIEKRKRRTVSRKISAVINAKIKNRLVEGVPAMAIAEEIIQLGLLGNLLHARDRVYKIRDRYGIRLPPAIQKNRDDLKKLIDEGLAPDAVADELNFESGIYAENRARRFGLSFKRAEMKRFDTKVQALLDQGFARDKIAERLSCGLNKVHRACKRMRETGKGNE